MASTNLFEEIFLLVDDTLDTYIIDTAEHVVKFITPIFTSLVIIWVAIWGYMILMGKANEPLQEGVFRILRITFIITLGLTVTNYTGFVTDLLLKGPEQLASIVTGSPTGTSAATLDELFTKIFKVADTAFEKAGILRGDPGMYIIGLAVLLCGAALVLFVAFLILLSKIAITVLLAIGPLFIVLVLFKATQRFFESWLGQVCNFGILMILAAAMGVLMVSLAESYIKKMGADASSLANLADAAMLCIVLGLCVLVIRQVQLIASALGGGVALATQGAFGAALNAMRPSKIRNAGRQIGQETELAARGIKTVASTPVRDAKKLYAAYQKRFGNNSLKEAA